LPVKKFCLLNFSFLFLSAVWGSLSLGALDARARSVETTVVYRRDGSADITQRSEWIVSEGEMHAFTFQGETAKMKFDPERCWADIGGNQRVPLEIKRLGPGKYDVALAGGAGFSGAAYFVLSYRAGLAEAGMAGLTAVPPGGQASEGTYFYFDWAPADWEYPLESRTTLVVLPITVPASAENNIAANGVSGGPVSGDGIDPFIAGLGLYTEEYVNQQNSIDWLPVKGEDGENYLALRFYQKNLRPKASQRIQFYLYAGNPAVTEGLGLDALAAGGRTRPAGGKDGASGTDRFWPFGLAAAAALGLWAYRQKLKGFEKNSAALEELAWAGDQWEPPAIAAGSYQIPGKVAENLHPVEVALLLNLELSSVVSIILDTLSAEHLIEVMTPDPLNVKILSPNPSDDEIVGPAYRVTPMLRFDEDKQGRSIPEDIQVMVEPRASPGAKPNNLVGVQFQMAINNGPNGEVPYVYAVFITRGRNKIWEALRNASFRNFVTESESKGEYGSVVLRLDTESRSTGYRTDKKDIKQLIKNVVKALAACTP
jgi:hypothetical protein